MSFEATHNPSSDDPNRYADILGSLDEPEDSMHNRARHSGSFHALYDSSTPAGPRSRLTDEIDASDLMVDSEDEDSVHSQQSSLPNPVPTFQPQQQQVHQGQPAANSGATGKWPDTGIDAFLDSPHDASSSHNTFPNQTSSTAATISNDLDYFLSNSHPDVVDHSKSTDEEALQVGASPDITDMFASNTSHATEGADASNSAPVTNALDDFLSSPLAEEPSPSPSPPHESPDADAQQSNSRDEVAPATAADEEDLQSPVKSAVGSVHEMSPPPAPIENATQDVFELNAQQQQEQFISPQSNKDVINENAAPADAPTSESTAAAAAALDDELDSYFHGTTSKSAETAASPSSVESSPPEADADTTTESVNVSANAALLESDVDEDGAQQLKSKADVPVAVVTPSETPSPAAPTVSVGTTTVKSSPIAPVATAALPFPSSTHSTLTFSAAHSKSLLSLQELQYALESELFAFRAQQDEAERAFQLQQSDLQSSIKRAEQQLLDLSNEKTDTRGRVASLQTECESLRNQLTALTTRKLSLETAQLSLIEARRARCHRLFLDSQPLFTMLRLNQAVIERKHRQFLRQFKREAINKAKARGEENIHLGGDETDDAAGETVDEFSPVNTSIRLKPRGPPQVKRERDRAQSVIHASGATMLPPRRSSLPPSSLPSLNESILSNAEDEEEPAEPSAIDAYDAEDATDPFNALPVDFPFDEAIAAMGSNGAIDTLNIFPRRYGTLRSLSSLSADPSAPLEEGTPRLRLPSSIIENIFSHLGVRDIQHATSVSRDWQVLIALKTQVWKHLLTRVSGVELRIKKEKEREKRAKRQQHLATPQRLERANSVSQLNNENGATTVSKPAPLIHAATAVNLHADGAPHLTPPQSPAASRTPVTPSSNIDVGAIPETAAATKSGGLFGMFRRFRGGSVSNATNQPAGATSAATGSTTGPANAAIISAPPTPTQSPGPNQYPQQQHQQLPQLLSHQQAMHLHYDLCIEITSRDVTSIRVDGRLARSSVTIEPPTEPTSPSVPPTCTVRCGELDFADTSKGANSVTMHLCPLRRSPQLESELEFCRQLFALQANLTQARMERAKLMSSIDGEDGIKKQHTAAMDVLKSQLAGVEYEIDRMRKQKQSDEITRDFLLQQLENMKQSLQHEKQRTEATRNERKEKAEAASVESQQAQLVRQQQAEMQAELRAHKKQLTKEVKMMQAEVERETKEKDRIKAEYEKLVATLEKLKGI